MPAHWTVVGRDSQALLIAGQVHVGDVNGEGTPGQEPQLRYCLYAASRFHVLVTDTGTQGGYADILTVGKVALRGTFAAYDSIDVLGGGRYGTRLGIDVTNLLTGKDESAREVFGVSFQDVLLAPPLALWTSVAGGNHWFVQAFDGRNDRTTMLEYTTGPDQDPFGGLQFDQCVAGCTPSGAMFAWWTDAGVWHSALIT